MVLRIIFLITRIYDFSVVKQKSSNFYFSSETTKMLQILLTQITHMIQRINNMQD